MTLCWLNYWPNHECSQNNSWNVKEWTFHWTGHGMRRWCCMCRSVVKQNLRHEHSVVQRENCHSLTHLMCTVTPMPCTHLCSCWCTKDSNGHGSLIAAWVRYCTTNLLARHPWLDVLQAGSDSSSVSEWPRTTVPVRLLHPGRQCWHSAASAFHQPSTTRSASLPAQHLRLSGLFSCQPRNLELSPGFYPGPDHQCRLFQTFA